MFAIRETEKRGHSWRTVRVVACCVVGRASDVAACSLPPSLPLHACCANHGIDDNNDYDSDDDIDGMSRKTESTPSRKRCHPLKTDLTTNDNGNDDTHPSHYFSLAPSLYLSVSLSFSRRAQAHMTSATPAPPL